MTWNMPQRHMGQPCLAGERLRRPRSALDVAIRHVQASQLDVFNGRLSQANSQNLWLGWSLKLGLPWVFMNPGVAAERGAFGSAGEQLARNGAARLRASPQPWISKTQGQKGKIVEVQGIYKFKKLRTCGV